MTAPASTGFDGLAVGDALAPLTVLVTRATLVRYAGACGDFNPIHWNERVARSVGLPGVIAHGMLTMALAGRCVTAWAGDPARVVEYSVTFTRPVVVPDDDEGATVQITGVIGALDVGRDGVPGTARVDLTVKFDGQTVLGKARAVVRIG